MKKELKNLKYILSALIIIASFVITKSAHADTYVRSCTGGNISSVVNMGPTDPNALTPVDDLYQPNYPITATAYIASTCSYSEQVMLSVRNNAGPETVAIPEQIIAAGATTFPVVSVNYQTPTQPGASYGVHFATSMYMPECSDGIDNDGDGYTDFNLANPSSSDPGCTSRVDDGEANASPQSFSATFVSAKYGYSCPGNSMLTYPNFCNGNWTAVYEYDLTTLCLDQTADRDYTFELRFTPMGTSHPAPITGTAGWYPPPTTVTVPQGSQCAGYEPGLAGVVAHSITRISLKRPYTGDNSYTDWTKWPTRPVPNACIKAINSSLPLSAGNSYTDTLVQCP